MSKKKKKTVTRPGTERIDINSILKPRKRMPDLDKVSEIRKLAQPKPNVQLGGQLSSVLPQAAPKTAEQTALQVCGNTYEAIGAHNKRFTETVAVMVSLRQAYAVAYRELQSCIEEAAEALKDEITVTPEFADFAVQFAMWQAAKPFNEHDMINSVINNTLPWLADTIDIHTSQDAAARLVEVAEANERRRNTPLPLGFKCSPVDEDTSLTRDRALVLFGWRNAISWLFDQVSTQVLAADEQFNVLRMFSRAPKPEEQHARLVRLAPTAWRGAADTDRAIDTMVMQYIEPAMGAPIDLLMVDDLSEASTAGFIGRSRFACAGDAHRRLKRWVTKLGAGLIAAVPIDSKTLPDTTTPDFEQLRTFTNLRSVAVTDGAEDDKPEHYKIVIGQSATVLFVEKATLDAYGTSTLIVPSLI